MGHHCVVQPTIAIVYHIAIVHQQISAARIAAIKGLAQACYLVSAKQTSGSHFAIGRIGTVVSTAV